jgi:hypothetical protein
MHGIGQWFKVLGAKLGAGIRRFMTGRYGTDKLNTWILGAGVVLCIVSVLIPVPLVKLILTVIAYGLLIWSIFRSFSRNVYKRYRENRRFLMILDRFKDREHRYFDCPKCRQSVRVPRHKGKIAITCPKCGEKFVRKT